MADGKVVIQVLADTAQFDAQIAALGTQVQNKLSGVGSAISSVGGSLTKGITLPLAGIVSAASATSISFLSLKQNATTAFTTMLGSADAAQAHISELYKFAKTTPFRFEGMLEGSQTLVAMGMNASKVVPVLKAVGDAAAASGKGQEGFNNIVAVLGKIQAQGKLSGEEIMRLSDNGINAIAILANKAGVSAEEMRKQISNGAIGADEAIQMLVDGIENGTEGIAGSTTKMGGLMENLKNTWTGQLDSLKSSWRSFSLAVVGESENVDSATSKALDALTPILKSLNGILKAAADNLAKSGVSILPIVNMIADALKRVQAAIEGMSADQFGALVKGAVGLAAAGPMLQLFGEALQKLAPLGKVATKGVGGLMNAISSLASNFGSASSGIASFLGQFGGVIGVAAGVAAVLVAIGAAATAGLGVLNGMGISVEQVFSSIGDMAANAMNLIVQALDGLAAQMPAVIEGIDASLPSMMEKIMSGLQGLIGSLSNLLPQLTIAGVQLITGLITGFANGLPQMLAGITTLVMNICNALIASLPMIIQASVQLFSGIIQALPYVITNLVTGLTEAIPILIDALVASIPIIIEAGVQLLNGLIDAIPIVIPQLIDALLAAIPQICQALMSALPQIVAAALQLFLGIAQAILRAAGAILSALGQVLTSIVSTIGGWVGAVRDAAVNMMRGLIDGIGSLVGMVVSKVCEVCGGIVDAIKGFFGIHSPSRLMAQMGGYIMRGLEDGIDDGSGSVVKAMRTLSKDVADAAPKSQDFVISGSTLWDTGANSLAAQVAAASASPLQVQAQSAAANTSNELADIKASLTLLMNIVAAGQVIQMDGRELGRTVRKMA